MTVYTVQDDDNIIIGVFSTHELAIECAKEWIETGVKSWDIHFAPEELVSSFEVIENAPAENLN